MSAKPSVRPSGSSRSGVSDATERIQLRRRRGRLRRVRAIVIALVVAGVVAVGGWLVGFSQVFAVTSVAVHGASLLTQQQVEAAARVPLGSPLAFTDPAPIEERVRSLPEVRDATVSRSWPNTIRIEVTEREPVFVLNSEGAYWLVDADGVTYHRVGSPPEGLLVAVAETTDGTVLRDIATVVSSLPEALAERVTQVRAATADSITLMLTGNARVIWGSAADSELKGQVATALLGQKATIYDVSSPTHPVTR